MNKILIGIIVIVFIYIILLLPHIIKIYNRIKKANDQASFEVNKQQQLNSKPVYNKSTLNFNEITIKNRYYLETFINNINPHLPPVSREESNIVDDKSHILNKNFYKN